VETPRLDSVTANLRPGGMRACPAGSPVKAHAPVIAGFQHPALAVAPRGHRRDEISQGQGVARKGDAVVIDICNMRALGQGAIR